jgi:hypothetical protein
MRYLEIDTGQPSNGMKTPLWVQFLEWILPKANPDIGSYFRNTKIWWLEVDESGLPHREIGFDANGDAIVLGPIDGNYGFLLDASDDWSNSNADSPIAAEKFEDVWVALWPKFEELDRSNRLECNNRTTRGD